MLFLDWSFLYLMYNAALLAGAALLIAVYFAALVLAEGRTTRAAVVENLHRGFDS